MRRWARVLSAVAGTTALLAAAGIASSEDGKAAFERREATMKRMGRPFYVGIGRVVKGTTAYGPDTVAAAETVASVVSTLQPPCRVAVAADRREAIRQVVVSTPRGGRLDGPLYPKLMTITPVVMPSTVPFRDPEHRDLFMSGLRLAAGETA